MKHNPDWLPDAAIAISSIAVMRPQFPNGYDAMVRAFLNAAYNDGRLSVLSDAIEQQAQTKVRPIAKGKP